MTDTTRETVLPVQLPRLLDYPLFHGITTRDPGLPGDGDINIAGRLPREQAVHNRAHWAHKIGVDPSRIVTGRQVHGNGVHIVDRSAAGRGATSIDTAIPGTDALATREIGLPLMVYTADCVPVIIYDPHEHAVGIAHAGWRGTVANVTGALVREMAAAWGSVPANLVACLGPSIGPCCYEVGDEVIDAWKAADVAGHAAAISRPEARFHFDLWRANTLELQVAGVRSENIDVVGLCTRCHADRFFSRRAGNGHRGLFATVVALTPR